MANSQPQQARLLRRMLHRPEAGGAISALLVLALSMVSCAPPKAIVVALPVKSDKKKAAETVVAEAPLPGLPNDGIRVPDMLNMPGEGDFRPTNPTAPKTGPDVGTVISRPPTDPPSRVKPKAPDPE